jgi:hypothetical protein
VKRDILVALYSEDPYVLDWMSLLVVRDWRTRVITTASQLSELSDLFQGSNILCDAMVIDLDNCSNLKQIGKHLSDSSKTIKVLGLTRKQNPEFFKVIPEDAISGLLYKQEIEDSLGWAISFAFDDTPVYTALAMDDAWKVNFFVPNNRLVLKSRNYPGLTDRQSVIAKLAIIYSITRRDLADELKISDQWSYGVVSELYNNLGLGDILDKNQNFESILETDKVIKTHIDGILEDLGDSKKARDLETLAFHLITMPVIE